MNTPPRPIFRDEAVQRYVQRHEKAVLPQLVRPRWFFCLWLLVGMLLAGAAVAWFARVPVYASGPLVVARQTDASGREGAVVAAFLPAEYHDRLAAGQPMWIRWDGAAGTVRTPVLSVEPGIDSPDAVRKRYGTSVTGPVTVATAAFAAESGVPLDARFGSAGHADVEVGSRRVLWLLPGMAAWRGSSSTSKERGAR